VAAREDGQVLLEYGLLASLIATFLIGSLEVFGGSTADLWTSISVM
jgi:Flp pilus assembly pilin Flp